MFFGKYMNVPLDCGHSTNCPEDLVALPFQTVLSHEVDIEPVTTDITRGSCQILIPVVISPIYI